MNLPNMTTRAGQKPTRKSAAPIGWLMKILVMLGKAAYWVVRLILWILDRRKK